jgi:hypothetical protein
VFCPRGYVVGLAGFVGSPFAVYGQVEQSRHDYAHCAPWAWGGTSNRSAARKKTAWPSGPEIIRSSNPSKGVSTCGSSRIQSA